MVYYKKSSIQVYPWDNQPFPIYGQTVISREKIFHDLYLSLHFLQWVPWHTVTLCSVTRDTLVVMSWSNSHIGSNCTWLFKYTFCRVEKFHAFFLKLLWKITLLYALFFDYKSSNIHICFNLIFHSLAYNIHVWKQNDQLNYHGEM